MKLRWYSWTGIVLLAILVPIVGALAWIVGTNAGARWTLARASAVLNDALQIERLDGTLAGPLTLTNLAYRDPRSGLDVTAEHMNVDLAFRKLFAMTVQVATAELRGVEVRLSEPTEPPPEKDEQEDEPFALEAPVNLIVERFVLRDLHVVNRGQSVATIDSAGFAGQWIGSQLTVRELDVRAPQGEVHFSADVSQSRDGGRHYEGEGKGRFRWRAGERTFAGSLDATARDAAANLLVGLTAPLDATLTVELRQVDQLPWKLTLDAPTFDPREALLPDSSLHSLAARLNGEGSLREGTFTGLIEANQEPIRIQRAHFVQHDKALDLDARVQVGSGNVTNLELKAQVESKAEDTSQRIRVEQLDIAQAAGRFAANGTVELQPQLAWSFRAQARQLDPGAFTAQWPGSLNFDLDTQGRISKDAPQDATLADGLQGTLVVNNLRGRLRGRDLGGRVNLQLSPGMVIAGDLDLRSGQSRIRLVGKHAEGMGEEMDAVATIEVPSVNDWLPDTSGEVRGRITAQGRWPDLNVAGQLNGRALHIGTALQADTLALRWNIDTPAAPSGNATLDASKLAAGGFELDTVRAQIDGDMNHHALDVDATGTPLAAAFRVEGSLDGQAWAGTIQRLVLDAKDVARLTLQEPVNIRYSPELVQLSQACFADGDIRLCAQGDRASNGVMHAVYSLRNVPLALASTFASLPLSFAGTLDGDGNIESDAAGAFKGRADIRSTSGRISRELEAIEEEPEVLLAYNDLSLTAELDGTDARARLDARLNDTGSLNGRIALQGLAEPTTGIEGEVSASLPSLRVIEVFAPQLVNVHGRADLRATVRGTLDEPQIGGEFRVEELGMDVPVAGLKLREGALSVTPMTADRFRIAGGIRSGPGRAQIQGEATTAGSVEMRLTGKQFQAADIPSANVIIDPDLELRRAEEVMRLTGSLHIPRATIDVQKLPQNQSTQGMSSDVVIVDAQTQEEAPVESTPLTADVKVTFGEEVELIGYGLEARIGGQLLVREQPGSPTTGSGEVRVAGTYRAYGQDLTIRQGQLLFAGTPLDNPRLSIVAVREIDEVTAGLRISGSAQAPILTVFSEPAMGQSDALAYIVTGKPLSEIGQGDASEGDMLQTAARSLGAAAGGLLAKNIGRRLGVDEFGVEDSAALGGAALTVGQYLSPRLYLSYGVGLFEPGEVITLRYKLSRSLALEALNGPEDSRAGLQYRKER
jgi:translocation and assembly module TamB